MCPKKKEMSKRTMMFGGYKFNKYFPNTKIKPFKMEADGLEWFCL